jgi:hypothetical protein
MENVAENRPKMFDLYQTNKPLFVVDRAFIQDTFARCEPLAVEALSVFGERHLWQGRLPVHPVIVAPQNNGGWGHLLPMWFKPHERPVPFYILNNWALFAAMCVHSFGASGEAKRLAEVAFTPENVVRVVTGSNLLLPFLPSTQGAGLFFRHGMLPYLLSILWLDEPDRQAWLRLHTLGAEQFITSQHLADEPNPVETLELLEFAVFTRLERNGIESNKDIASFLSPLPEGGGPGVRVKSSEFTLLDAYHALFGAICLGVTALAKAYEDKPLEDWGTWAYQEIAFPYRTAEFGKQAILDFIRLVWQTC